MDISQKTTNKCLRFPGIFEGIDPFALNKCLAVFPLSDEVTEWYAGHIPQEAYHRMLMFIAGRKMFMEEEKAVKSVLKDYLAYKKNYIDSSLGSSPNSAHYVRLVWALTS